MSAPTGLAQSSRWIGGYSATGCVMAAEIEISEPSGDFGAVGIVGATPDQLSDDLRSEPGSARFRGSSLTAAGGPGLEITAGEDECKHGCKERVPLPDRAKAGKTDNSVERVARECCRIPDNDVAAV